LQQIFRSKAIDSNRTHERQIMNQLRTLIETISEHVANQLIELGRRRRFFAGEPVASFGTPMLGYVNRGWFRLSRFDDQGSPYSLLIRRPGRFIGLESAMGSHLPAAEVVSLGTGELLLWPVDEFARMVQTDTRLAVCASTLMLSIAEEEALDRHRSRTAGLGPRIAQLLLQYAADAGQATAQGYRVTLPFSQQDLAEILEVRRETVSQKTCQLEAAGIIERSGRDLLVNARRARVFLAAADLPDDLAERDSTPTTATPSTPMNQRSKTSNRQASTLALVANTL
jgi:CRP/FNR family transcriptional regulator, cyclic AMP receptor protein